MKENFTIDELREMVGEVNSWNGGLDYLDYYENDEYFFREMFGDKIDEAVRAVCYGDYNYMDDYVRFNGYGNLESCSEYKYEQEMEEFADEIVDVYYENIDNMWNEELIEKVKKIKEVK